MAWVKSIKEVILFGVLLLGFASSGLAWVENHFATQESLERVDCFAKLNARLVLGQTTIALYQAQMASNERVIRDFEDMLSKTSNPAETALLQSEIRQKRTQTVECEKAIASEKDALQTATTALGASACFDRRIRSKKLDELHLNPFP